MDGIRNDEGKIWTHGDTLWTRRQPTHGRYSNHHARYSSKDAASWTSSDPTSFRTPDYARQPRPKTSALRWRREGGLDRSCPQDGAICHPQSRHAMNSTWKKSWRKTERDLATDGGKRDRDKRSQLGRVEEEGKGQPAVAIYGYGLMFPGALRGLSEWVDIAWNNLVSIFISIQNHIPTVKIQ